MKLCYQVATPDVAIAPSVTAYQGPLEKTFGDISRLGYDGVELMTLDPRKLNWKQVAKNASDLDLIVGLVCTGEICGQLGLTFTDPDKNIREAAISCVNSIIDFAGYLGAMVNIGRVRGTYRDDVAKEQTEEWAVEAFRTISDHAASLGVRIALENVTIMQTNFLNTLAEVQRLVDMTERANFGTMMDIFHMNIEEKNISDAIAKYAPTTFHVHLADNNRRYPGAGGLDFPELIKKFHESGYDRIFCTEVFQIPSMEECAKRAISVLAPIFHEVYGRPIKSMNGQQL